MGTTVRIFFTGGRASLLADLQGRIDDLEQQWSRFIADSDISCLNRAPGTARPVGADTLLLVDRALQASRVTRGWFDPTLLRELVSAGYDRTFREMDATEIGPLVLVVDRRRPASAAVTVHDWVARASRVELDRGAGTVCLPPDVEFDPGGIGKGLAADLVTRAAVEGGASAVLVDLGGDIATAGQAPEGGWLIDIEDPFDRASTVASVRVPWGAVATSSRARRRWLVADGRERHHLIDPNTGEPGTSEVAAATVIGAECWLAESVAKAAVLAGVEVGLDMIGELGLEALLIDADGTHHVSPGMGGFLV